MSTFELSRSECTEACDLASGLGDMTASAVQLRPGPYRATVSVLPVDDIKVHILRSDPVLLLGEAAEDEQGIVLVLEGSIAALWNGRDMSRTRAALIAGRSEHSMRLGRPSTALWLRFPSTLPTIPTLSIWRQCQENPLLYASPTAFRGLAAIAELLESGPDAGTLDLDASEARRSLRADLLEAMRILLNSIDQEQRPRRPHVPTHRIVYQADAYLRAHPSRPIYTEDLRDALGVSASGLADAFRANFGISPHRYLKMRRMGMARAMLLSRDNQWHSVKAAALSNGFWHLGQFAKDYRLMYGEAPHVTLARGLSSSLDS